jgi:hypothetical protein
LDRKNFRQLTPTDYNKLIDPDDGITNRNHIILGFYEFDYLPLTITKTLGLSPTETGLKGEEYETGGQKKIKRTRECNFWEIETKIITNEFIGDLVDKFAKEIIEQRVEKIRHISATSRTKLTVVQYYYDGHNPGQFFDRQFVKLLADIGAEIDIDTYCLSSDSSVSR